MLVCPALVCPVLLLCASASVLCTCGAAILHMAHASFATPRTGENPSFHSCWVNESDNKKITRMAASCHRRVFETRVLSSWALVQQGGWFKTF